MFGDKLKQLREKKKLTQRDMAELTGVGLSSYNGYEQGTVSPRADFIKTVCEKFNVSANWLLGLDNGASIPKNSADLFEILEKLNKAGVCVETVDCKVKGAEEERDLPLILALIENKPLYDAIEELSTIQSVPWEDYPDVKANDLYNLARDKHLKALKKEDITIMDSVSVKLILNELEGKTFNAEEYLKKIFPSD